MTGRGPVAIRSELSEGTVYQGSYVQHQDRPWVTWDLMRSTSLLHWDIRPGQSGPEAPAFNGPEGFLGVIVSARAGRS